MISSILTLYKREVKAYFHTPIAYVFIGVFFLLMGMMFWRFLGQLMLMQVQAAQYAQMGAAAPMVTIDQFSEAFYQTMHVILLFLLPFFTMRLFADEYRQNTIALLRTSPVTSFQLIWAKYKSVGFIYFIMLMTTLIFPLFLEMFSVKGTDSGPDWGIVFTTYFGLILSGSLYIAIGTFWSSVSSSQLVALACSIATNLLLWFIPESGQFKSSAAKAISYLSINEHMPNFFQGTLELRSVVYFFSFSLIWVYLSKQSIESRSWRS